MNLEQRILQRSASKCELCESTHELDLYELPPVTGKTEENTIQLCATCLAQVEKKAALDPVYWAFLTGTMWSEIPVVQILTWRMLNRLRKESWAQENLDMMYLSEEHLAFAKAAGDHEMDGEAVLHQDSNGHVLQNGDNVVLTKTLDVKGSTIQAKLGTVVRNIRLVADNPEQIEGKVDGQQIVILTKYLRKQN